MNGPLTRPSASALLPGRRFCSVSSRPARRARSSTTESQHKSCSFSVRSFTERKCLFIRYIWQTSHTVKWHMKEVNHRGYSHCALLHIDTTDRRIYFLGRGCCRAIHNINTLPVLTVNEVFLEAVGSRVRCCRVGHRLTHTQAFTLTGVIQAACQQGQ